jgi:hypothetical protein
LQIGQWPSAISNLQWPLANLQSLPRRIFTERYDWFALSAANRRWPRGYADGVIAAHLAAIAHRSA